MTTAVFEILAEPHRRRVLDLLRERERTVGELVDALDMSQPAVSKHLRVLRDAGLVEARVDAQRRIYRLRAEPLADVDAWLEPYRKFWRGRLAALQHHLASDPAPATADPSPERTT
ncbi:MAG TPA: metalloregulator ArsR/SmtB family transcription factor [Gemmatimonadaceae bacterium]|nr:metalloregulator ArsR/SmtB family transcription factor [Gemmatimonadaceae bacterium]